MIENKQAKNKNVHMVIIYSSEVDFLWTFCGKPKSVTKNTEFNVVI